MRSALFIFLLVLLAAYYIPMVYSFYNTVPQLEQSIGELDEILRELE